MAVVCIEVLLDGRWRGGGPAGVPGLRGPAVGRAGLHCARLLTTDWAVGVVGARLPVHLGGAEHDRGNLESHNLFKCYDMILLPL